jgi:hypothetical protein
MNRSPQGLRAAVVDARLDFENIFWFKLSPRKVIGPGVKRRMLIPFKRMIGDTFSLPAMLQALSIYNE